MFPLRYKCQKYDAATVRNNPSFRVMSQGSHYIFTMTSWNGNIFRVTGRLCGEFIGDPHKCQWRGALMFSLICVWISDWANYREAGDLRRYRAHYDVIAMFHVHQHITKPHQNAMLKSVYFYGNSSGEIDRVVACHTLWKHNLIRRLRGFGMYHELVSPVFQVLKRQPAITIMLRLMGYMQNRWHGTLKHGTLKQSLKLICGIATPYSDTDLGQYWLRQRLFGWQHQAITWTNADLSSIGS